MISKLTEKRKKHIESCILNNDNSHQVIADLYSDPSHFIFELLQNAEDVGASEVNFIVEDDKLIIEHHNGRPFNFDDVDSITTIGSSTKTDKINQIGKFGVGFKSVFEVTKTPIIHSGGFNFKITDFIIPDEVEATPIPNNLTKIILPFNHDKRTMDESYEIITNKLKYLGTETLLFLKNINEIRWETVKEKGHYLKEVTSKEDYKSIFIIANENHNEISTEYLVIDNNVKIKNKDLTICIAYQMEEGRIIPAKQPYLSVYFPTKEKTDLNFLVHAPYKTTPDRETINFNDEENEILTEKLSELAASNLSIIKKEKLLDVNFLEMLPIEKRDGNTFYSKIYGTIKKVLSTQELLPTSKNEFASANKVLLARGEELALLLSKEDLECLFRKESWLNTEIRHGKTRILRDYIVNELGIKEIQYEDFAKVLDECFLEKKSDEWMIEFYESLSEQNALFSEKSYISKRGILRDKPIIRLNNNQLVSLFDKEEKIQIYLLIGQDTEFKTVKEIFIQNEQSKGFFEKYKISKPNRISELKEFTAPRYIEDTNIKKNEYLKDIKKILQIYNEVSGEDQKIIEELFKDKHIILTSKNTYSLPNNVYIPTEELILWFENNENIYFVNDEIYQERNKDFFVKFGCNLSPRRIQADSYLTKEDKKNLTGGYHSVYGIGKDETVDYDIEALRENVKNITLDKSILLWCFLLKKIANLSCLGQKRYFEGIFKWDHYGVNSKEFKAKFLKTLKEKKWLIDKDGNLKRSNELTINDLNEKYDKENENINILEEVLGFKLDEIKQIERKTGGKFIFKEDVELFLQMKKEQEKSDTTVIEDGGWIPEIESDAILNIESHEIKDKPIETPNLSSQDTDDKNEDDNDGEKDDGGTQKKISEQKNITQNTKNKKKIGEWGEKIVKTYLIKKYKDDNEIKVRWLNANGNTGKGYDFAIEGNGKEIEYIEVKAKIYDQPELIEITGTQWEWARKLYNKNEGDKYKIFVVLNAGTKKAKIEIIENPIKKWKEGSLKAHPVNFEL